MTKEHKCVEDWNGYCYTCERDMLNREPGQEVLTWEEELADYHNDDAGNRLDFVHELLKADRLRIIKLVRQNYMNGNGKNSSDLLKLEREILNPET